MPWRPRNFALLWDIVVISLSGVLAHYLRLIQAPPEARTITVTSYLLAAGIVGMVTWWLFGFNRRSIRHATRSDAHMLGLIAICAPLGGLIVSFLFDRGAALPRSILILHFLLLVGGLIGARVFAKLVFLEQFTVPKPMVSKGAAQEILLIGDGPGISSYIKALRAVGSSRTTVQAAYVLDSHLEGTTIRGQKVLAPNDALWSQLRDATVDQLSQHEGPSRLVVAANPALLSLEFRAALAETTMPVSFFGWSGHRSDLEGEANFNLVGTPKMRRVAPFYMPWKRLFDIAVATTGLIVAAIPLAVAAIAVRLILGSPVTFWQWRPGRYGQSIRVLKLRSMRDAIDGEGRRLSDAERLGWFGTLLRRSRLDELPQLYSILIGEMSLVGPRPLIHQQQRPDSVRLLVRPGLTGWAQVNGGQLLSEADKERLDCWYVDNLSFALDLKIMVKTVWVVLFGDRVPEGMAAKADPLAGEELYEKAQPSTLRGGDQ
jgi:lipopolysaccharide/colanic/teichoic acid biosynthesis glycosyltransferase